VTKITAIVSAYHSIPFIEDRILNLQRQDPQPEIIIVCQRGSYEHNMAVKKGVHNIATCGIPTLYEAWNMAIREATGDYIVVANTDDEFYEGALDAMGKALDDNPTFGMVYSDVCLSVSGSVRLWIRPKAGSTNEFADLLKAYFIGPMPMWRKSLHEKYGMFDRSMLVAGDLDFWLRCAHGGERYYYIPRSLGMYRRRMDSLDHREKNAHAVERSKILRRYRKANNESRK